MVGQILRDCLQPLGEPLKRERVRPDSHHDELVQARPLLAAVRDLGGRVLGDDAHAA